MDFLLRDEHLAVRDTARNFASKELLKGSIERDKDQIFPYDQVKKMGELGFMGMIVDSRYGGSGMDTISYVLALEEIAKVDASCAVIMSVNNSLVCSGIEDYGNDYHKKKYLKDLASGKIWGAFCLSEPEAGSDASSQRTVAIEKDDYYLLNGTKNWITNGGSGDVYLVFATTNKSIGYKGIDCFIVEKKWDGVIVGNKEDKMGIRSSDTHTLIFNNVRIPKSNRMGEPGNGFRIAMAILNGGRIGIASQALGIASGAYELALKYASNRRTFGKPIIDHQSISFMLSDMATNIEAARMLVLKAAYLRDKGKDYVKESAMAKLFASEMAMKVTNCAIQIHGGYGYVRDYYVERFMRDAKITQIYEGTSEILRLVIARCIKKK